MSLAPAAVYYGGRLVQWILAVTGAFVGYSAAEENALALVAFSTITLVLFAGVGVVELLVIRPVEGDRDE